MEELAPIQNEGGFQENEIQIAAQVLTAIFERVSFERAREIHERVCVFVDYAHIRHSISKLKESKKLPRDYRLDVVKLVHNLVGNRNLVRAYIYDGILPEWVSGPEAEKRRREKQLFAFAIQVGRPFEVKLKNLVIRNGRWTQKGVDVEIAVDMLGGAVRQAYDTAILLSGDMDFASVIREVQRLGRRVELACFRGTITTEFKQLPDKLVFLDDLILQHPDEFRLQQATPPKP